ncbi:putative zinc ribbon protein [Photorhabdus viridis]|uniref:putative zinc ribbon protein n=1 Tax=Photorhabdus viridis TaxID=3163327 RepID=UPI003306BA6E
MNYFVFATHAVTVDGEWVTPESVQQVDFDSLLCIYCKLQIGVQFDPLTSTRTFVHIPRYINNVARLKTCRFNKLQTVPEQTSPKTTPHPEKRLRPTKTTIRQWQCCWCHVCWHGEKICPQCADWIYTTDA